MEDWIKNRERKKVWIDVFCAVASAFNSDKSQCIAWADRALEAYNRVNYNRKRFLII